MTPEIHPGVQFTWRAPSAGPSGKLQITGAYKDFTSYRKLILGDFWIFMLLFLFLDFYAPFSLTFSSTQNHFPYSMPFHITRSDKSKCAGEMNRSSGEERPGHHLFGGLLVPWALYWGGAESSSPSQWPPSSKADPVVWRLTLSFWQMREGWRHCGGGPAGEKDWTDPHRCFKIHKGSCKTEWR